ncbi:hypothetical protein CcarbDRAFT_4660 [Clostridium carboxidivorans P7]|uniref:Uncharacterized protein n=1 Tax=Clostridium carboxidivorans P7 TaxID=536227 RepID=C6Q0U3_9CLOT|nr:hypothetical protein CcarbDRAFT_4660 [Clostridium carboxidivorans P7]
MNLIILGIEIIFLTSVVLLSKANKRKGVNIK